MEITEEYPGLETSIRNAVADAFGWELEADLVDGLRAAGCLAVSLAALRGGEVCGYAALSRLQSPPRALALAPVAVRKEAQGNGIGSALIRAATAKARELGFGAIFVLGAPAYYGRFGFSAAAAEGFASPYAGPNFMALHLTPRPIAPSPVIYPEAFGKFE